MKCTPNVRHCDIMFNRRGDFLCQKEYQEKNHTGEFKQKVVETMHNEKLTYAETSEQFEPNSHSMVKRWERIYLEEGPEGLYKERRGRKSTGRPKKLAEEVEEDLIAEVQR